MKTYKPLIFVVIIFSLISAACLVSGTSDNTTTEVTEEQVVPATEQVVVVQPTQAVVAPTEAVVVPTEEYVAPENEPQAYFTEQFDGDLSNWTWFMMSGDENKMDLYTEDGYLVFDLEGEEQYVYVMYDPYTYTDVKLEVSAENRGKNTNNVSLICNYSEKYGWYEFSITNGGMFYIYVYSELDGGYDLLASGGSQNVVTGRHENTYTATCEGNQLALYVNGHLEYEMKDNRYNLTEGQVGFGVSSFSVLPIIVYVNYVDISAY